MLPSIQRLLFNNLVDVLLIWLALARSTASIPFSLLVEGVTGGRARLLLDNEVWSNSIQWGWILADVVQYLLPVVFLPLPPLNIIIRCLFLQSL